MKIEAVQGAVLSNAEVLKHFNEEWAKRTARDPDSKKDKQHADKTGDQYPIMANQLNSYFSDASKVQALPDYSRYPEKSVRKLLNDLKRFELTKAELVMILNLKPTDTILLDVIIEELDVRVADSEDQAQMLETINQILGSPLEEKAEAMDVEVDPTGDDEG